MGTNTSYKPKHRDEYHAPSDYNGTQPNRPKHRRLGLMSGYRPSETGPNR